jgi:hypothetical protein
VAAKIFKASSCQSLSLSYTLWVFFLMSFFLAFAELRSGFCGFGFWVLLVGE